MSHMLGERHRVHRDLRMIVLTQQSRCFQTDGAITQRSALSTASYDSNVLSHMKSSVLKISRLAIRRHNCRHVYAVPVSPLYLIRISSLRVSAFLCASAVTNCLREFTAEAQR